MSSTRLFWAGLLVTTSAVAQPPQFGESSYPHDVQRTLAGALLDLDGDGHLDLAACGRSRQLRLHFGDRFGALGADATPGLAHDAQALLAADVDADGDPDLVAGFRIYCDHGGCYRGGIDLLHNDGNGNFALGGMAFGLRAVRDIAALDFDADGDLDLALAVDAAGYPLTVECVVLVNTPNNPFFQTVVLERQARFVVAAGDLSGNGWPDLVFAGGDHAAVHWNRRGSFQVLGALPAPTDAARDIALIDVDADGDLDMFVVRQGVTQRLLLNDGGGGFTDVSATHLPPAVFAGRSVAPGDFDGDGDLDLLITTDGPDRLFLGDGQGRFTDHSSSRLPPPPPAGETRVALAGDLDGDQDLDAVLLRYGALDRILVNRQLQLDADETVPVGGSWQLDAWWRPQFAGGPAIALVAVSAGEQRPAMALPGLGLFRLDASRCVTLPWLAIPTGSAQATCFVPLPADPRLAGHTLYTQALELEIMAPETARLTAPCATRILP